MAEHDLIARGGRFAGLSLCIDRLVLHGVPAGGQRAVAAALQAELQRALASDPALARNFAAWAMARERAGGEAHGRHEPVRIAVPAGATVRSAARALATAGEAGAPAASSPREGGSR